MAAPDEIVPIPQVPKHWFLGNLPDVDPTYFSQSIWRLAELYGPIFKLDLGGSQKVVYSTYEIMHEVADDHRFEKLISSGQFQLRPLVGDGLFTAFPNEPKWAIAHRILMPVFGHMGVRKMFDQQLDIASQLILRWDRYGPDHAIHTGDDFTKLALDTVCLCAFNTRLNEFYMDAPHIIAQTVSDTLLESGRRANRSKLENVLRVQADRKYFGDIAATQKWADAIVAERVQNPKPELNDLLNTMLHAKDPKTGEGLDPENIRNQMITFMIAGHETTSGTLASMFYLLLKNPEAYHQAQQEVDDVLGTDTLTVDHISKFKYIEAAVKETLRCSGPLSILQRHAKETTIIGGKYQVGPEVGLMANIIGVHHDPKVWGDDADKFKPERMLDFSKIPAGAWKPFGTGMRSCIGRAFAEQEIVMNVALILQRFQVEMVDPAYKLEYKAGGALKPKDFFIKVRRRPGRDVSVGLQAAHVEKQQKEVLTEGSKPLLVIYGSNAGTCQAYSEELISNATRYGFRGEAKTLDSVVERIPKDRPIVVITPTYEGKPTDNAKKFVSWLETTKESLQGVRYSLFGVGNSEWSESFHKIPKLVDHYMEKLGAEKIVDSAFADVKTDSIGPFEDWADTLFKALGNKQVSPTGLKAKIDKGHMAQTLAGFEDVAIVKNNVQLADSSVGSTKMLLEVELPADASYRTGDYLAVLPENHRDEVRRVLARFNLNTDDTITISNTHKEFLKSERPLAVVDLLLSRVELNTPITQRQLEKLADVSASEEQQSMQKLLSNFEDTLSKRFSILDVLEDHPHCAIEFTEYLDMLKPMTARQYSISSFNLPDGEFSRASITYDVHETEAWSGHGRTFHGVASSYLASCKPGSRIHCSIRPTNSGFHLPKDPSTPIIMVCAGTGIAPMRGFIEERAAIKKARDIKFGPALLYFGCRDASKDFIYKDQLEQWEKEGVVSVRPCFSKSGGDFKYTSDRLYAEKDEASKLFRHGAKIFVCGSASKLARSTAETCKKIYLENNPDKSAADADQWLDQIKEDRYVSDVFG